MPQKFQGLARPTVGKQKETGVNRMAELRSGECIACSNLLSTLQQSRKVNTASAAFTYLPGSLGGRLSEPGVTHWFNPGQDQTSLSELSGLLLCLACNTVPPKKVALK